MKFLLADDHVIVRKGIIQMLLEEFPSAEITEVTNGNEALRQARNQIWDAILLDISMPGQNGIKTLHQIRAIGIKAPILMISTHSEEQYALRLLRAGASGFLNKENVTEELLSAVHTVLSGRKYTTSALLEKLEEIPGQDDKRPAHEFLSDREMQVLRLIASGKTVFEIEQEISLSISTISAYHARILEKLSLNNNAELTRYALDNNLV